MYSYIIKTRKTLNKLRNFKFLGKILSCFFLYIWLYKLENMTAKSELPYSQRVLSSILCLIVYIMYVMVMIMSLTQI